ncbi:hypothetical protein [Pseudonocardia adelaidensis]
MILHPDRRDQPSARERSRRHVVARLATFPGAPLTPAEVEDLRRAAR